MKKIVSVLIVAVVLLSATFVYAQDVSVYLNGARLEFDVEPRIINDRTMVPMRKIFEALGAIVTWDGATQTVTGKKGDVVVNVSIDSKVLFKNGSPTSLDVAPVLIDGRTLVPARAIAESFDCKVDWDGTKQRVDIATNVTLTKPLLTAAEVSEKVSPAVFYIEVYDSHGDATSSGSGFFIASEGVAVTNYHVIDGSYSAKITTIDGEKYTVTNVVAYDEALDVAIIRVSKTAASGKKVSGFSTVTMADSDKIKAGQVVYALGSPVGLQNTISNGIISNVNQVVDGTSFIQTTAAISHGSSGGALVDEHGEVLGITSAGIVEAQNIGFVIPINIIKQFELTATGMTYSDFASDSGESGFTLDIYPESVNISVGETAEVLVYAEGKGDDWAIYYDTEDEYLVECEWGDWLEENDSVCPLYITGLASGITTVTVYSDVDFRGVDITVRINRDNTTSVSTAYYPGTSARVPTYTSVTGVQPIEFDRLDSNDVYSYSYYDIDVVQSYVDYLFSIGFEYYDEEDDSELDSTIYYYESPDGHLIGIVLVRDIKEIWIYIPRK